MARAAAVVPVRRRAALRCCSCQRARAQPEARPLPKVRASLPLAGAVPAPSRCVHRTRSSRCDGSKGGGYLGPRAACSAAKRCSSRSYRRRARRRASRSWPRRVTASRLYFTGTPAQLGEVFSASWSALPRLTRAIMSTAVSAAGSSSMGTIFGFRENMSPITRARETQRHYSTDRRSTMSTRYGILFPITRALPGRRSERR